MEQVSLELIFGLMATGIVLIGGAVFVIGQSLERKFENLDRDHADIKRRLTWSKKRELKTGKALDRIEKEVEEW